VLLVLVLVVVVAGNDVLVDPVVLVVVVGVDVLVDPVVLPVVVDVLPVVTVVLTVGAVVFVLGDELCQHTRLTRQGYANAGEAYSRPPTIMTVPTASAIATDRLRMRAPPTRKVVCAMDPSSQ